MRISVDPPLDAHPGEEETHQKAIVLSQFTQSTRLIFMGKRQNGKLKGQNFCV
jgi:hypothetical protein